MITAQEANELSISKENWQKILFKTIKHRENLIKREKSKTFLPFTSFEHFFTHLCLRFSGVDYCRSRKLIIEQLIVGKI